jgi:hypothetical protein
MLCDTSYAIARIPKVVSSVVDYVCIKVADKKVLYRNYSTCDSALNLMYDFSLSVEIQFVLITNILDM